MALPRKANARSFGVAASIAGSSAAETVSLAEAVEQLEHCSLPTSTTYASLLRQCIDARALREGKKVHDRIAESGYSRGAFLGNLLVQMYGSCGSLEDARMVFHTIHQPNAFSFNTMMAAYAQNGCLQGARRVLDQMPETNVVSWTIMMTAYAQNGHLEDARSLFHEMPERNVVSRTAMIRVYAQMGELDDAKALFDGMPERNAVSWNVMIAAYAQGGHMENARSMFDRIPQWNVVSWTTMLAAYVQKRAFERARQVFETMHLRNVVSWNAMMAAYAENEQLQEASGLFERMAWRNVISWTTMIDAYAQRGDVSSARAVFDEMPERNAVSWGILIAAYAKNHGKEALKLFQRMDMEGSKPEEITFVAVLDACANVAALAEGRIIHGSICSRRLQTNVRIGCALVHMYGKCGQLEVARGIFDELPVQDLILWTAVIAAYAQNGHALEALHLFQEMQLSGIGPDSVTFVSILAACSHAGLKADGWLYIVSMTWDYGITLLLEHYVCILDLLGRAGQLEELEDLITNMPYQPTAVAWTTLLSACRENGDEQRAARAARALQELNPKAMAPYALLSNLHAAAANRDQVPADQGNVSPV